MSVICETCRSEVPGDAVFCPECGTPPDSRPFCQIGWWRGYLSCEFVAVLNGETIIARSKGFRWRGDGEFPTKTTAAVRRLRELGQQLVELGWRYEEADSADPWYAWRFLRERGSEEPRQAGAAELDLDLEPVAAGAVGWPDEPEDEQLEAPPAAPRPRKGVVAAPRVLAPRPAEQPIALTPMEFAAPAGLIAAAEADGLDRQLPGPQAAEPVGFQPPLESSAPELDPVEPTFAPSDALVAPPEPAFSVKAAGEDPAEPELAAPRVVYSPQFEPELQRGALGSDLGTWAPVTNGSAEHSAIEPELDSVPEATGPWYQKPRTDPVAIEVDSELCTRVHAYTFN